MSYSEARGKYAAVGVDAEAAIAALAKVPVCLHTTKAKADSYAIYIDI